MRLMFHLRISLTSYLPANVLSKDEISKSSDLMVKHDMGGEYLIIVAEAKIFSSPQLSGHKFVSPRAIDF